MSNIVQLKKLKNNHLNMVEDLILHGNTQRKVAKKHGVSEAWLSRLRQTELFKEEERSLLQLKRAENLTKLNALVPAAVTALEEVVGPSFEREDGSVVENDQKVRVKAAKEILNRAGYKSHEKNEGQPIRINMYVPPHMREPGEEDNETITITIDPVKDGRGGEE